MKTEAKNDYPVKIDSLTRRFDNKAVLNNVSFEVKRGQVFGIVGENGAGKTTLIQHILGLYKAQQGKISVFGRDPVKFPEEILAKIGYLSEEPELPAWMKVSELVNYSSAFYKSWDKSYANQLLEMFRIDSSKPVKSLSKGQKARVGLCLAQAHRPDLLLLDEPSSGLDPNVRNDILSAIIQTVVDEGRTVIFSSHLLEEVERVSDHLMMLSHGCVLLSESMDDVLTKHHRFILKSEPDKSALLNLPGVIRQVNQGHECLLELFGDYEEFKGHFQRNNLSILEHRPMTLSDIFVSRTKDGSPSPERVR